MLLDQLQRAGLAILEGDSPILDVARDVSAVICESGIHAAVIGGVAVVLHGHTRTTLDVDVYTTQSTELAAALEAAGFANKRKRQFEMRGVPVQLVAPTHVVDPPGRLVTIDDIRTVSLADLISIKLRSGSSNVLRAQDLADVIGLIRRHKLGGEFAARVPRDLRREFRALCRAVRGER